MRLPAGHALRAAYEEDGGPSRGRVLELLAEPGERFAVRDPAGGLEARCDGTVVWAGDGDGVAFAGEVPAGPAGTFALLPALLAELLHSESAYLHAAFADPSTTDEELELGCVRISGSDLSIVYDRSIDVVHEYRRPDGLRRRLVDLEVVPTPARPPWADAPGDVGGGRATVSTVVPVAAVDEARSAAAFAARVEHASPVLRYWLDGPGSGGAGAPLADCLAWARSQRAEVRVTVDLLSGESVDLPVATTAD